MFPVAGSISHQRIVAPVIRTGMVLATHDMGEATTSVPGPAPAMRKHISMDEETLAVEVRSGFPINPRKARSNSTTFGPWLICPSAMALCMAAPTSAGRCGL